MTIIFRGQLAVALTLISLLGFAGLASASNHFSFLNPFTQNEIDSNWEADRQFPSDGATSVSAFGRDDVARIGVDGSATQSGTFQRTEGIKTVGAQDFGTAVRVDLYIDPDWEDQAVRNGFWVVGDNGSGARDEWYGIIEFVNLEPSTSGNSSQGDHEGWRFWDSENGWTNLDTVFTYGEWVTLGIELDTENKMYNFYIDGELVGSGTAGENFIRELFLNSYNYGLDVFPNLGNGDYTTHWHVGIHAPMTPEDCKNGGWEQHGYKNQGQCVRDLVRNERSNRSDRDTDRGDRADRDTR